MPAGDWPHVGAQSLQMNGPPPVQYFAGVQAALRAAGLARPTLVIDRERLDANLRMVRSYVPAGWRFRVVGKSLPVPALLEHVMGGMGSRSLMAFSQPFLSAAAARWPDVDLLLGKPLPVAAAARFYDEPCNQRFDAAQQVQWLVDTPERLVQYETLAQSRGLSLRINLEIDVGFHRGGLAAPEALTPVLDRLRTSRHLRFAGFMGYDAHLAMFRASVGEPRVALPAMLRSYAAFIDGARAALTGRWNEQDLTLNTGGSTTCPLYRQVTLPAPVNDLAAGSAFVKPAFCDVALPDLAPAVFIATPVLKVLDRLQVPGLALDPNAAGNDRRRGVVLDGGRWMAEPAWPAGLATHALWGRSSNQEIMTVPGSSTPAVDDFVFLRPLQSETVLLQFGDLAVYDRGSIVDAWTPLPAA